MYFCMYQIFWGIFCRLNTDTELIVMCTAIEYGGQEEWDFVADNILQGNTRRRELASLACTRSVTQMQRYSTLTKNRDFIGLKLAYGRRNIWQSREI